MKKTNEDQLTTIVLSVFHLNGKLIEWGDAFCFPHGLTSARWQVLGAIAMSNEAPSIPQIATAMGQTRQGVLKQINLLVAGELIQPLSNPSHKRSHLYILTEKGQVIYQELIQQWKKQARDISNDFKPADMDTTIQVISALSEIFVCHKLSFIEPASTKKQ